MIVAVTSIRGSQSTNEGGQAQQAGYNAGRASPPGQGESGPARDVKGDMCGRPGEGGKALPMRNALRKGGGLQETRYFWLLCK
jgi:hypothetical protein